MAIDSLLALVPPPADPIDAVGDWSPAEAEFGVVFPGDFKELIRLYGTGVFLSSLLIYNPLTREGRAEIQSHLETLRVLRDACELSLIIHPEKPGLLPWGGDSNGNIFCWWTEGNADEWDSVQVGHEEEENPHRVSVPITTFLVNYAQNRYPEMLGGQTFKKSQLRFDRGRPWER
jgi:SMI1-KNR4 cell-wall